MKTSSVSAISKIAVVDSVKKAFQKKNRLATIVGTVLGSVVPWFTFSIGHHEVNTNPMMWMFVAGGLSYSALSVYDFAKAAFKHPAKALGFVILVEGAMTFSNEKSVSVLALCLLIAINAITAGVNLSLDSKENRNK